jgi:hypothetical protein
MTPRLRRIPTLLSLPLLLALPLGACGYDEPDEDREVIKPVMSTRPEPAPQAAPGGAAPAPREPAPGQSTAGAAGQLAWELPAGWREEQPSSAMRMAQASVPGDAGAGELAVFHFGPGGGGGVEANVQRWLNQVQTDPGTEPERETFETEGLTVHTVAARGTVTPSPMSMMGGSAEPQPGHMLLGAVVEGPGGPWFFKATGPAGTMEPQREAFFEMTRNARLR